MTKYCIRHGFRLALVLIWISLASTTTSWAGLGGGLKWNRTKDQVSADINSGNLRNVLEEVAAATGWQVFLEPNTSRSISTKFNNLPPGDALQRLLGDVNFALVPATNGPSKLYVFRTTQVNATQLVEPAKADSEPSQSKAIPNELIVRLKPGAKIDELAKLLGAKVVGRIDGLNAYRLQFEDASAADSARDQLADNPDVTAVDSNYIVERPQLPQPIPGAGLPPPQLQLKPPPDSGRIIIGLVDTSVQPLGNNLDQFIMKQLSVAGDVQVASETPTHGTAMAETILRSLQDITKGITSVQILPVNIYPGGGVGEASTTTFDVANGITAAVNGGGTVLNLSLGSANDSEFLHDLIKEISKRGIPIFAAAGNEPVTTPYYPAAYPEVKAVTAIDRGHLAPYANRGSFVSLGAPGNSVVSFGSQSFTVQGTSVSSAFTSGLAAGYLETSGGNVAKMQTFMTENFGVKITPTK